MTAATATLALGLSMHGATEKLYWQTRQATAGPDVVMYSPGTDRTTITALESLEHAPGVVAYSGPDRQYYTKLAVHGSSGAAVVQVTDPAPRPVDRPLVTSGTWVRPGGAVLELKSADVPVTSFIALKLRDPAAALTLNRHDPAIAAAFANTWVHTKPWQHIAQQDFVILRVGQPILAVGSRLLGFLAVGGMATLAAGRATKQTRRVGLLKAVGASPGLITAVLLAEYATLELLADALGLTLSQLLAPVIVNPTASLLTSAAGPSGDTIAVTTVAALAAAALTTFGPALRALRTGTVSTLADPVHRPRRRALLNRISALLPTPLLLGLRLIARRPGRTVLHACNLMTSLTIVTGLLIGYVQPVKGDPGSPMADDARVAHDRHLLLAVTAAVIVLALVNTIRWERPSTRSSATGK
ncbi:FtsX-like permease family protein [Actinomadura montaniterrae]|uniref:FtsX-like permease family protein n=1 Tax=Actinomadura montaniterrae TaxID=1803903 RepID=UPI001CEF9E42|nr:FtsX-like permease family protein [Actinomadura montaniterrae]